MQTNRGPQKEEEKERETITFFYGKIATMGWDPDRWRLDGLRFLNYTTKLGRGAITSRQPGHIRAVKNMARLSPGKSLFTNGGPALLRCPFPSNAFSASQTLASLSNINFGNVFKLGELGDGPPTSCKNSVGLDRAITTASIGSKQFLRRGSPRNMVK